MLQKRRLIAMCLVVLMILAVAVFFALHPSITDLLPFPAPNLDNPPLYPGAQQIQIDEEHRAYTSEADLGPTYVGEVYKTISFYTQDGPNEVLTFYRTALADDGWPTSSLKMYSDSIEYSWNTQFDPRYQGKQTYPYRTVRVTIGPGKLTSVTIQLSASRLKSDSATSVPAVLFQETARWFSSMTTLTSCRA